MNELKMVTEELPVRNVAIARGITIPFCQPKIDYVNLTRTTQLHTLVEPQKVATNS